MNIREKVASAGLRTVKQLVGIAVMILRCVAGFAHLCWLVATIIPCAVLSLFLKLGGGNADEMLKLFYPYKDYYWPND